MCVDIAHQSNVISGIPPSKSIVRDFIRVADKNSDGIISFDECEIVALLLCEHCAFQVSAYWLATFLITPFVALAIFQATYRCMELDVIPLQFLLEMKGMIPEGFHSLLDEKLIFLLFIPVLNYFIVPWFVKLWTNIFNSRLKLIVSNENSSTHSSGPKSLTLDTKPKPVLSPSKSAGKVPSSIYDVYDDGIKSRVGSPINIGLESIARPVTPNSPTCTSPDNASYPISYAQFQFVSTKDDVKPSTPSPSKAKSRRRASAPPNELSGSVSTTSDDERVHSSGGSGKSKTPTVFKKLRNSFVKNKKDGEGKSA